MSLFRNRVSEVRALFLESLRSTSDSKGIEALKVQFLGKKGPVQALLSELRNCTPEERPTAGQLINELKEELHSYCERELQKLSNQELEQRLQSEWVDIGLPGRKTFLGRSHPVMQTLREATDILIGMGFSVRLGPDIESDYYNFEGLNFPPGHPAREMQDTFYLSSDLLLRTHTSNVQVRALETLSPPIRIVTPGRCFRNEDVSPRSHVFFHQIEGLYVDRHVTLADLMVTMEQFWSKFFGQQVELRFRPSYFPFVAPGLEIDVRCTACRGAGCRLCKHSGWLEVCGAGMVHPNVLKQGRIDPEIYTGYAWGMGLERLCMLRHGISDIRLFTENDIRFLEQF